MNVRLPARISAFACLGVAATMGLLALRDAPSPVVPPTTQPTGLPEDPLQAKLQGCQLAGEASGSDPTCLAAWAENRRRFLGQPLRPIVATELDNKASGLPADAALANAAAANLQQVQ